MAIKAQVAFSLIQIPVRVETMTSEVKAGPRFRNLHVTCETPINEQKVCRVCDQDVNVDEIVKGVEVTKDNFVTFTEEELDGVAAEKSPLILIEKFVPAPDPMWVEREYWLPPENASVASLAETYATFCDALEGLTSVVGFPPNTRFVGFGKAALWGKERPVTVSASVRMLTLQILHTQAEFKDAPLPCAFPVKEQELALMTSIIEERTDTIDGDEDLAVESDRRLRDLISAKVSGTEWSAPEPVAIEPPTTDLLETLRAMKTPAKRAATKKKVSA